MNIAKNPGFEADWGDGGSHLAAVLRPGEEPSIEEYGSIHTPPDWLTWYVHVPGTWDQPEVRDAHRSGDPRRVRSGQKAVVMFSFHRRHDGGLLASMVAEPGKLIRVGAWGQAWSNHTMESGRPDDPMWSDGAGTAVIAWPEGSFSGSTGDEQEDAKPNMTFRVGIDPAGGVDPRSARVVWGKGYHIYNGYPQQLMVEATALAEVVTVFLRSTTLWAFKHGDTYWDDVTVEAIAETPRTYQRTYVLLPQAMTGDVADRLFSVHRAHKQTVGFSADDAAAREPRLERNDVIVYDAETSYPGGAEGLRAFWRKHYREPDGVEWLTSGDEHPLLLWQGDERWADVRLGDPGCDVTIGQQGCFVTCLAMARRAYKMDAEETPAQVNAVLQGGGFAAGAPCRPLWTEIEERLALRVRAVDEAEAREALDDEPARVVFAEVQPAALEHFVMVTRREGERYWALDPLTNREGWLDVSYSGVQSWRSVDVVTPEPPPAGEVGSTLHLQTMSFGWDTFVRRAKPTTCKVFSFEDAKGVRRASPGTLPVVRIHDANEFDYCFGYPNTEAGQEAGARAFIRRVEDSMRHVADELEREHPGLEPPYYALECLNEGYATNGPHNDQIALFETKFAELMPTIDPRVAGVTFCAAVGNPGEWEFGKLVRLARATADAGGFLGYHGYWFCEAGQSGMTAEHWPYLHGRWAEIDAYLVARGILSRWFLGESGAVGGRYYRDEVTRVAGMAAMVERAEPEGPWAFGYRPRVYYVGMGDGTVTADGLGGMGGAYELYPHDGHLHPSCYGGDTAAYIADIVGFEEEIDRWNQANGGRCFGDALFTTGEDYTGWPSFQFREREMIALLGALGR